MRAGCACTRLVAVALCSLPRHVALFDGVRLFIGGAHVLGYPQVEMTCEQVANIRPAKCVDVVSASLTSGTTKWMLQMSWIPGTTGLRADFLARFLGGYRAPFPDRRRFGVLHRCGLFPRPTEGAVRPMRRWAQNIRPEMLPDEHSRQLTTRTGSEGNPLHFRTRTCCNVVRLALTERSVTSAMPTSRADGSAQLCYALEDEVPGHTGPRSALMFARFRALAHFAACSFGLQLDAIRLRTGNHHCLQT